MSKKKLTCHCGGVEAEVNVPENGFEKVMRCNCSICKRKGYIIGVTGSDDFKKPIYIDYRPDTLCNLACSHCTPGNSTKIEEIAKSDDKWKEIWPRSVENVAKARELNIDTDKMFTEMVSDNTQIIK